MQSYYIILMTQPQAKYLAANNLNKNVLILSPWGKFGLFSGNAISEIGNRKWAHHKNQQDLALKWKNKLNYYKDSIYSDCKLDYKMMNKNGISQQKHWRHLKYVNTETVRKIFATLTLNINIQYKSDCIM